MPKSKYTPGDFTLEIRKTPGAGRGLFTASRIPKDAIVIEYTGRLLTDEEYNRSRSRYLFDIGKDRVIDGWKGGSRARYINHSCVPNCKADNVRGRIYIRALRTIHPGEELAYDSGKEYFDQWLAKICSCPKCKPLALAA